MSFKLFMEVFGQSFKYEMPSNKRQQLFDFYIISHLATLNKNKNRTFGDEEDWSDDSKIDYTVNEIQDKILSKLKEQMLDDVFFSLCAEFRHVDDDMVWDARHNQGMTTPEAFKYFMDNVHLNEDEKEMLHDFLYELDHTETPTSNHRGIVPEYDDAYKAGKTIADRTSFVKLMSKMFRMSIWDDDFGGAAWGQIADAWLALSKAKSKQDITIQIDHIYDLEHNNNTVFDKIADWGIFGDYNWLEDALNKRANAKHIYGIIDDASPLVKALALKALKAKTGETLQKHQEDPANSKKPIDQEVSKIVNNYNLVNVMRINLERGGQLLSNIIGDAKKDVTNYYDFLKEIYYALMARGIFLTAGQIDDIVKLTSIKRDFFRHVLSRTGYYNNPNPGFTDEIQNMIGYLKTDKTSSIPKFAQRFGISNETAFAVIVYLRKMYKREDEV